MRIPAIDDDRLLERLIAIPIKVGIGDVTGVFDLRAVEFHRRAGEDR